MAIITNKQFSSGIKTLGTKTNATRSLIQELLITAVFFAERDGDVGSIQRVVDAVQDTKSYDMWKVHKWLHHYEAPIKPSEDGKTYVFNSAKRHLHHGASREDFAPYETIMRMEAPWYEMTRKEVKPSDVFNVEAAFDNFIKKLEQKNYVAAADSIKAIKARLVREGKMKTLTEMAKAKEEELEIRKEEDREEALLKAA